ncbi:MAG: AAA family ATPase [bacterium]|jgi:MoxR-like ATPase
MNLPPSSPASSENASDPAAQLPELYERIQAFPAQFKQAMSQVIVGQEQVLDLLVTALFSNGHVLLTGVPGLAKTLLIRSLAQLFHLDFNRIQCTPDLMPSDISGVELLEEAPEGGRRFRFVPGPVFTNLLLADEINRTSPRTQAALLQAMQERQVTAAGKTYVLQPPFLVFATQNPIDSEGTYPLPEAQLDRFLFNISVGYPSLEEEVRIAESSEAPEAHTLEPLFEPNLLQDCQRLAAQVPVPEHLVQWTVRLVRETRPQESQLPEVREFVEWGAGVRASQSLIRAARAHALLNGAGAVRLQDLKAVAPSILRHRIILNFSGEAERWDADRLIAHLLASFSEPRG